MREVLDLDSFPIDQPESKAYRELVSRCQSDIETDGMFNLDSFLRQNIAAEIADNLAPLFKADAFVHSRRHNIYFNNKISDLRPDHPALKQFETVNHTICADQIVHSILTDVYQFQPLINFLADVMGKTVLFPMEDPLARINVMSYNEGEALNWHFDRSEFTTTMLLQAPVGGGEFEYRQNLRSDSNPNYDGVGLLLEGKDPGVQRMRLNPGTLNVFKGKNTAHRVTAIKGDIPRMIAVFSYFDKPGFEFSTEERIGFYGRAG